ILKQQQDMATLSKDQLANQKQQNDYVVQHIDNVAALPAEQQPAAFEAAKTDLVQKGLLDPQQAQGIQYQGPQQLKLLKKGYLSHSKVIEDALKTQQTKEAGARAAEAQANTKKVEMETAGGMMTGAMADSKYRNIKMAQQLKRPVSPEDAAFAKAYERE